MGKQRFLSTGSRDASLLQEAGYGEYGNHVDSDEEGCILVDFLVMQIDRLDPRKFFDAFGRGLQQQCRAPFSG